MMKGKAYSRCKLNRVSSHWLATLVRLQNWAPSRWDMSVYLPFVSKCAIWWCILSVKFWKIILPIILSIMFLCVNYLYALSICGFRVCELSLSAWYSPNDLPGNWQPFTNLSQQLFWPEPPAIGRVPHKLFIPDFVATSTPLAKSPYSFPCPNEIALKNWARPSARFVSPRVCPPYCANHH